MDRVHKANKRLANENNVADLPETLTEHSYVRITNVRYNSGE